MSQEASSKGNRKKKLFIVVLVVELMYQHKMNEQICLSIILSILCNSMFGWELAMEGMRLFLVVRLLV